MNCQKRRAQIALDVEGDLPRREAGSLATHLAECAECREAERQLRESQDMMKGLREEPVPDAICQQIQQQVLARISSGMKPETPFLDSLTFLIRGPVRWAGAVLALLLVIGVTVWIGSQDIHVGGKGNPSQVASKNETTPGSSPAQPGIPEVREIKKLDKKGIAVPARSSARGSGAGLSGHPKASVTPEKGPEQSNTELAQIYREMALWQELEANRQQWEEQSKKEKSPEAKDKVVAKLTTNDPNIVIYWLEDAGKGNKNEIQE
jgi:hypothetical protein